jgi:magnesium chelatase accessory protein
MQFLDWERDGHDWPNRGASRLVRAAGMDWHVQVMGQGPVLLLLHGTGASSHSYGDLLPLLARDFTIVNPDLPGHGFTQKPPREFLSLPGMSRALASLLRELSLTPDIAVGHSAGAAVAIQMTLSKLIAPRAIVSLNGALLPLAGTAGAFFAPLAKIMVQVPFITGLFARRAHDPVAIQRLVDGTGSVLDRKGVAYYRKLASTQAHVEAALGMMANWDLRRLVETLPKLKTPLMLIVGSNDKTIRPADARRVQAILPQARIVSLKGLGHLAHEERPAEVATLIRDAARDAGLLPAVAG